MRRLTVGAGVRGDAQLEARSVFGRGQRQEVTIDLLGDVRPRPVPRHHALVLHRPRPFLRPFLRPPCPAAAPSPPPCARLAGGRLDGRAHRRGGDKRHPLVGAVVPSHVRVRSDHVVELDEAAQVDGAAVAAKRRHARALHCVDSHIYQWPSVR